MNHPESQATEGLFEFSGGALCLDFANSWGNRGDPGSDLLVDYDRLLLFGLESGEITAPAAETLHRAAASAPEEAELALARARELRESLYQLFSARVNSDDLPVHPLDSLNRAIAEALSHRQLRLREDGFAWSWREAGPREFLSMLWPCVDSAATLLTSEELGRVRACDAEDCTWLFLDRSRSRSRRWCSMESCGNRAKARRHYRRRHKA